MTASNDSEVDPEVAATTPVCETAWALVWPRIKDLSRAVRRLKRMHARKGADLATAVHRVRVASRRAGVTLDALRLCADPQDWTRLRRVVKRIRRAAGVIRDADVQLALLKTIEGRPGAGDVPGLAALIAGVELDKHEGLDALWPVLDRSGAKRLRVLARRMLDHGKDIPGSSAALETIAANELGQLSREVYRLGTLDIAQPEPLHEFRLAVKRLRYAAEVFSACVPENSRKPLEALLEECQRRAGEANDLMTLVARVDKAVAELSSDSGFHEGQDRAFAALGVRFGRVADMRRRKLREWWSAANAGPLLETLGRGTSDPQDVPGDVLMYDPTTNGGPRPAPLAPSNGPPSPQPDPFARPTTTPATQRNLWLSSRRLAVIDIGSNSIRLLAVEVADERTWKAIAEERAMTRLAQGMGRAGLLSAEAMARSVEAVGRFKTIAENLGVTTVRAYATAAVRDADNRNDFISLVQDRTGLKLEVVSALDEGKLTHRSVSRVFDLSQGTAAVVDIGGGSMEVVFSRNGVITENSSMPLGAVRLTERFGGADAASGRNNAAMRRHIEESIAEHVRPHETSPTIVVGCGGTFTTLLTLAAASRGVMIDRNSPALAALGPVSRTQLKDILKTLRSMTLEQRLRVPGLPSDRADIVVAGFTAIERLLKYLDAANVRVHPGGFREGLLMRLIDEQVAEQEQPRAETPDAGLLRSARALAARCAYEQPHSEHVAGLALSLYDQFRTESNLLAGLGSAPHERALLESAAVLHDVGIMVEYPRHHKHSQTIIRHGEMNGWTPHQIEIVAMIARYHRRADPSTDHPEFAALGEPDRALVRRLAAILRVADGLDRSHAQPVEEARLRFGKHTVHIEARTRSDATVDLKAARKKSELLTELLGMRVEIADEPRTK